MATSVPIVTPYHEKVDIICKVLASRDLSWRHFGILLAKRLIEEELKPAANEGRYPVKTLNKIIKHVEKMDATMNELRQNGYTDNNGKYWSPGELFKSDKDILDRMERRKGKAMME